MSTMIIVSDVSGTTILDDGTKVHWTEGRSSYVAIEYPDGTREASPVARPASRRAAEVLERLSLQDEVGHGETRDATRLEIARWGSVRRQLNI